jgi:hypothetical protein
MMPDGLLADTGGAALTPGGPGDARAAVTPGAPLRALVDHAIAEYASGATERKQLARCAHLARTSGVKPEQLVVMIRLAWEGHHAPAKQTVELERERIRFVNRVLEAYFGGE